MSGEVFSPKSWDGKKLPAHSHGPWLGRSGRPVASQCDRFRQAGYLVVTFDYRGWGDSDSRVVLAAPEPHEHPNGRFVAEVQEVREVVDVIAEKEELFDNRDHALKALR